MPIHTVWNRILPGLGQDGRLEFRDFTGRADVVAKDRYTLVIELDLPAGLVRFDLELHPRAFDFSTLYCEMTEYPSGGFVRTGPWDLAMDDPPRMQVPTLDVFLDGEQYGNLWFEMPGSEDIREQKLGGVFALLPEKSGRHTVTLVVPDHERRRLDFSMLATLNIGPDQRDIPEVRLQSACRPERPWLFLGGRNLKELHDCRAQVPAVRWSDLERTVDRYFNTGINPIRGCPVLASAAFIALLDGPESAAFRRLETLLKSRRGRGGFLETHGKFMFIEANDVLFSEQRRWIMGHGWNDYGFSWLLLDYACVLQWLGPWFEPDLRAWIEEQLLRYGRELYRFTVFQRQYAGAQGGYNAHLNVPMLAVAALGAVLEPVASEAHDWLRFGAGRIRDSFSLLPLDYPGMFLLWNPPWILLMVEFLRDAIGECHRGEPFLRELPAVLWRTHILRRSAPFVPVESYFRMLMTSYCASVLQSTEAQWYYQVLLSQSIAAQPPEQGLAGFFHILWHTPYPGQAPSEEVRDQSVLWPATGFAMLQSRPGPPALILRFHCGHWSGSPRGAEVESYAGAGIGEPFPHGGFDVWLGGRLVLRHMSDYRMSFRSGNFVTVDGDGFFMDSRWLPGRSDMTRAAFLRQQRMEQGFSYLDGINTLSYRPELELVSSRRQIFFDPVAELAVIVDEVDSRLEHHYALLLHSARITELGGNRFHCFAAPEPDNGAPLNVHCFSRHTLQSSVETGSLVLPYMYGVTQVKGGPKLSGEVPAGKPPEDRKIVCAAAEKRKQGSFITVAAAGELISEMDGDLLRLRTPGGTRVLRLLSAGLSWV